MDCSLRSVVHVQLIEDMHHMAFNGMTAEGQDIGNFVGKTLSQQPQYLGFTTGKLARPIVVRIAVHLLLVQELQALFQSIDVVFMAVTPNLFNSDIKADLKGVSYVPALIFDRINPHLPPVLVNMGSSTLFSVTAAVPKWKTASTGQFYRERFGLINFITRSTAQIDVRRGYARPQKVKFRVNNIQLIADAGQTRVQELFCTSW